jgi:glycolate oxidase
MVVVLANSTEQVSLVVRACQERGIAFVARGNGTGLSAGALPVADGVLIVLSKFREIHEIDPANQRAVVDPGVINLDLTKASREVDLYYAPDPSSQQVCSIGGNVAENSGGAHCLKYGFTTHHITGLEVVTPDGDIVHFGGHKTVDAPGYDLLGAFVGSEGTLGIATKITTRLVRRPQLVKTILAAYDSMSTAGEAVSSIIASGILPAAIEMMDALAIEAAEKTVHCGYPEGANAVLIVELDGPAVEVALSTERVVELCQIAGATVIRIAKDEDERALIWKGRKSAFAAVGTLSPDFIVQDGVIPRTSLPKVLAEIAQLSADSGIRVANVFHAGDGNLHPLVLFNGAVEGELERANMVSGAIIDLCIKYGGSITGEHGVGADKIMYMGKMFNEDDLDTMQMVRCAFDTANLCNPGKIFPTPRLCGEIPGHHHGLHPLVREGLAEIF